MDILDEQGNKTGQTMLKSQAHAQSLRHGGAHVWIYNSKGDVLLQLRHPSKVIRPNVWDVSAAGHIASGDTPEITIVREFSEELGLKIEPQNLTYIGIKKVDEPMPGGWIHRVFNWTYLAEMDIDLNDIKMEKYEVSDIRWLPVNEFKAELEDSEKRKKYTPGRIEFYMEIISEIRKRLGESNGKTT